MGRRELLEILGPARLSGFCLGFLLGIFVIPALRAIGWW